MMYGIGNGNGTDMTWWMGIYSVVWFVLIALAIAAIVVWIRSSLAPETSGPRRILEERFARGEIDDDEFHRRLKVLH